MAEIAGEAVLCPVFGETVIRYNKVGTDSNAAFCAALLATLKASPELRSLHFTVSAHMADFEPSFEYLRSLSDVLRSYAFLVECTLDVNYCILPYHRFLPLIASWPKLRRLHLCNDSILSPRDGTTQMDPEDERKRHAFSNVTDLTFDLGMTKTIAILRATSFPTIQRCDLHLRLTNSVLPDLRPLFRSMSTDTLETLSFILQGPKGEPIAAFPSDWAPLGWFHNLRELSVVAQDTSCFGDALWDQYARSWPFLRRLEVEPNPSKGALTRATYKSLASIARWCPEIAKIAMHITDSPRPADLNSELEALPVAPSLTELQLWHSPIKDLEFVAECITTMFPSVWQTVRPSGLGKCDLYDTRWQTLFTLVEQCRRDIRPLA